MKSQIMQKKKGEAMTENVKKKKTVGIRSKICQKLSNEQKRVNPQGVRPVKKSRQRWNLNGIIEHNNITYYKHIHMRLQQKWKKSIIAKPKNKCKSKRPKSSKKIKSKKAKEQQKI